MNTKYKDVVRFHDRVDRSGGVDACWPWLGKKKGGKRPYGIFWYRGFAEQAHRIAYMLAHGSMPSRALYVCHRCDNPRCVNPAHLFLGDAKANNQDRHRKGRTVLPNNRGSRNGVAKLDEKSVTVIKNALAGGETGRSLAARFGVSETTISVIKRGKAWR